MIYVLYSKGTDLSISMRRFNDKEDPKLPEFILALKNPLINDGLYRIIEGRDIDIAVNAETTVVITEQ